jgi:hypothetical protein
MKFKIIGFTVLIAAIAGSAALAAQTSQGVVFKPTSVTLPAPGGLYTGQDAALLNSHCLTCHSAGFVNRQPKLSLAAWTAEVTKMHTAFGASIDDANIKLIAQALVDRQNK